MSSKPPEAQPEGSNQGVSGSNLLANLATVVNLVPTGHSPKAQTWRKHNKTNQLCRYFKRGDCKYATRCRYSHTITEQSDSPGEGRSSEPHPVKSSQNANSKFPGLSNEHFSTVVLNYTQGKTFSSLETYVADSFRFEIPDQTAKQGQLHLHKLVKGRGIERLAEAIRFPAETTRSWSFQRGYIPIFTYLSSEWVVKSTLHSEVNALYGLLHREFQVIRKTVEMHMGKLMAAHSFKEDFQTLQLSGKQIFKVIFVTIFEYLTRFKEAPITNPEICDFTERMAQWFDEWVVALGSNPPFQDECLTYEAEKRKFIFENLQRDKERILRLIRRGQTVVFINPEAQASFQPPSDPSPGLIAALDRAFEYNGPGDHCETGPRHDNDHVEIDMIRVAPTHDELICKYEPYVPANFFEAPHCYEPRSIERLLDIQFRLLREELTSPVRQAVQLIYEDLKSRSQKTILSQKIKDRGGLYVSPSIPKVQESIRFSVFTGIQFQSLQLSNRGITAGVGFDTPPGKGRSNNPAARADYWEQVSKKRLIQDGLVALIWKNSVGNVHVYVGTVTSSSRDLVTRARRYGGQERVAIDVSFIDTQANVRILKALQNPCEDRDVCVLIEAPVFFEGIRPFLEGLKREPEFLPFAQYLKLQTEEELRKIEIDPPLYSRSPGFSFELKDLFPPEAGIETLRLNTWDRNSIDSARRQLRTSRLDESQADAVVDSLTQELALIQGPPGTGKSYTGLELIRVLVKNDICPILLVAFTNHALDQMLMKILDAEITKNIIRLGSRMDEQLTPYSLYTIEKSQNRSGLKREGGFVYREMKELESKMEELMADISSHKVPSSHIEELISYMYPHHYGEFFRHIPAWIDALVPKPGDVEEGWEISGESPKQEHSIIDFWLQGRDLQFLENRGQKDAATEASAPISSLNPFSVLSGQTANISGEPGATTRQNFIRDFMREHGLKNIPKVPQTTRPVGVLLKNPGVWRMSQSERAALHRTWSIEASDVTHANQIKSFEEFSQMHKSLSDHHKEITNQLKADILSRSHIVGCTTTGAAKFVPLLSVSLPYFTFFQRY
ncbi:unnamed protein product [Rhizoctonia solani]|uniref:C3H1-type domain-containing protein n=1 Tax=Rhizoctonia solani TaxID=456999 RepID=A0A8H3GTN5_9AGAM|nr:unnamed protein product [Rhizoctonia solani]